MIFFSLFDYSSPSSVYYVPHLVYASRNEVGKNIPTALEFLLKDAFPYKYAASGQSNHTLSTAYYINAKTRDHRSVCYFIYLFLFFGFDNQI